MKRNFEIGEKVRIVRGDRKGKIAEVVAVLKHNKHLLAYQVEFPDGYVREYMLNSLQPVTEELGFLSDVQGLYGDTVGYTPYDYSFGENQWMRDWDIALELTEEEMVNEEFYPMMNYIYPLPNSFREDMKTKFGENWERRIKHRLNNTTVVYLPKEDKYGLALTGGGMDLSWEICESYINLGYCPPAHFCDLPRMAGKDYSSPRNKRIINACIKSLDLVSGHSSRKKESLIDMLKKGV